MENLDCIEELDGEKKDVDDDETIQPDCGEEDTNKDIEQVEDEDGRNKCTERIEKAITGISHPVRSSRSSSPAAVEGLSSQRITMSDAFHRVFKKSSPNNKITIYLNSRDLSISERELDRLQGVLVVDPEYLADRRVYGQITLTFRYGREDEEVMGLKFCNEAVMSLAQLHPPHERAPVEPTTQLQEALLRRLGPHAHPFTLTVAHVAPPSVQLVPAKEYNGAPIGTSYDIRVYAAERPDEKLHRRSTVRMGIRVVQRAAPSAGLLESPSVVSSLVSTGGQNPRLAGDNTPSNPPHATVDKPFLLSEGRVELEASLDKATYHHGEPVLVTVTIRNNSGKTVRRIKVFVVQHVDVCMFSNGKFKNVVALLNCKEDVPLSPWTALTHTYQLQPAKGATKNWIALEDSFSRAGACLASTVTPPPSNPHDRNVFAIYVSYYVKVKILVGAMGGELSLKLPFTLVHAPRIETDADKPAIQSKDLTPAIEKEAVTTGIARVELHEPRPTRPVCNFRIKKSAPHQDEDEIVQCGQEEVT